MFSIGSSDLPEPQPVGSAGFVAPGSQAVTPSPVNPEKIALDPYFTNY
jgi:hypothetical protein